MFKYFDRTEFVCQETGENEIKDRFIRRLDTLREQCGFPFVVTSGYRSPQHSIEAAKPGGPGPHSTGEASDIAVSGGHRRYVLLREAFKMDFTGIGVHKEFIHLDDRAGLEVLWPYT
jgi:uncharacterized protein YcbK (DUF882 family)